MSETPTLYPVGPSLIVRVVMAPLTKMLNPPVARLAGRRRFRMAAQIHHVGRRSGKPYVTSVGARVHKGTVLIPLTFGNRSDWARNVYRAGECSVRVKGTDYQPWRRNSSRPAKPHHCCAPCSIPSNDSHSSSLEYGSSCGCSWPHAD